MWVDNRRKFAFSSLLIAVALLFLLLKQVIFKLNLLSKSALLATLVCGGAVLFNSRVRDGECIGTYISTQVSKCAGFGGMRGLAISLEFRGVQRPKGRGVEEQAAAPSGQVAGVGRRPRVR